MMELDAAILGRLWHVGWSGILLSHSSTAFLNLSNEGSSSAGMGCLRRAGRQLYRSQQDFNGEQFSNHLGGLAVCLGANPRR